MRIAIAGNGNFSSYICEEFTKAGHEIVILTRKSKPEFNEEKITQAVTDYSLESLRTPLAECDGLISTISVTTETYTEVHRNLILACQESPKCKRFIPAEFVGDIETYPDQPGFYYASHEPIREMLRKQTDIEWTLICLGWLADYFVPAKNRHIRDIGDFHPVNWAENKIVIPGTGNEPVDFTWARDVVRGLVLLLEAPSGSWEPYTFVSGERSSWNDAVKLFEQKYRSRFEIRHISLHAVVEMLKTAKDETTSELVDFYLFSLSQSCALPPDRVQAQAQKHFSGFHFRTLQDGLSQHDKHPDAIL